jgi:hypothetical protein
MSYIYCHQYNLHHKDDSLLDDDIFYIYQNSSFSQITSSKNIRIVNNIEKAKDWKTTNIVIQYHYEFNH